jgi:hypothetical protein
MSLLARQDPRPPGRDRPGQSVRLWEPKDRGSYAVTLTATDEPWRTL